MIFSMHVCNIVIYCMGLNFACSIFKACFVVHLKIFTIISRGLFSPWNSILVCDFDRVLNLGLNFDDLNKTSRHSCWHSCHTTHHSDLLHFFTLDCWPPNSEDFPPSPPQPPLISLPFFALITMNWFCLPPASFQLGFPCESVFIKDLSIFLHSVSNNSRRTLNLREAYTTDALDQTHALGGSVSWSDRKWCLFSFQVCLGLIVWLRPVMAGWLTEQSWTMFIKIYFRLEKFDKKCTVITR